jgi:Fic family protein
MKVLLKNAREQKGLKTREVAQLSGIDQALICKFEGGARKPTKEQILKLASLLEIDFETLMVAWLKDKIIHEIGHDEFALKALKLAEEQIKDLRSSSAKNTPASLQKLLNEIDILKTKQVGFRTYDSDKITQSLELEYTFESNRIEGNTMTLQETNLVLHQGLTISGKSMREHLEIINHHEAIGYIKDLIQKNTILNEREVLSIHNLILRGIHPEEAGRYKINQLKTQGSSHLPPSTLTVPKEMEDFFIWYDGHKNNLHPIVLAAEIHERFLTIHPFQDGNGKTARLIMNLVLLQHDYPIAIIKGDNESRIYLYQALETAQTKNNKEDFLLLIAQTEKESLERYCSTIGQQK